MQATITKHLSSFKKLLALYLSALFLAVILFMTFEHQSLGNAIWWATMTGLGIGYADILPQTAAGQVLTVLWVHFTVLGLLPLVVGYIILNVSHDRNEFTHEEQEELLNFVRNYKEKK